MVECVTARERKVLATARVCAVAKDAADPAVCVITVDADLTGTPLVGHLVENATLNPDVTIKGNHFSDFPHLRLSGRGKYIVEENRFERCMAAVVGMDLADYWFESGRIADMTIRNNAVVKAGGFRFGLSGWVGNEPNVPKVHGRVVLEGNTFDQVRGERWSAVGVRDFVVKVVADSASDAEARDVLTPAAKGDVKVLGRPGELMQASLSSRVFSEYAQGPVYDEAENAFATHWDDSDGHASCGRSLCLHSANAPLPNGAPSDPWSLDGAWNVTSVTRARWSLNGLWGFRPALTNDVPDVVPGPEDNWGWGKIPSVWDTGDTKTGKAQDVWMSEWCIKHGVSPFSRDRAWYRRDFTMPSEADGKRIVLTFRCNNSFSSAAWNLTMRRLWCSAA